MANTIKFGNTKWATKKDSILAFNDENANFKPLPFTTSRASTATRINKEGLIETVGVDVPRVDYLNNPKGAYLLEPQSTNLFPYSTLDFNGGASPSGWSIGFGTGTFSYEQLSYKGQKAVKQTQATTGRSYLSPGTTPVSANTIHTLKIQFILSETVLQQTDAVVAIFKSSGTITYRFSDINADGVLEKQFDSEGSTSLSMRIGIGAITNTDGGTSVAWAIPQLEVSPFATSYIPTSGSAQTRLEDDFTATLPTVSAFNSNNGFTFFGTFESSGGSGASSMMLQFNNNSGYTGFGHNGTNWRTRINNGATNITDITNIPLLTKSSLSIAISPTDYSIFANGAQQTSGLLDLSGSTIVNSIGFRSGVEFGAVRISDLRMYNTKLTDAELTTLTTI